MPRRAVTSPWYSGSVMLVAWENAALGNSTCTDPFATRSSGSGAGCARIRCRMRWPEIRADARQEENERKAAAEQALPCRQAVSSHGTAVSRRYQRRVNTHHQVRVRQVTQHGTEPMDV